MQTGLTISVGLHAAVAAALWFGPPEFGEPMAPDQPMPVEVVSADALKQKSTPTKPDAAPDPEPEPAPKAEAAPEPTSEPAETAQNQPEPAPEPPQPDTSAAPPQPEATQAPNAAPETNDAPAPKPRSKPDVQLAKARDPEPDPEPEPEAEPAPEPEPTTQEAKPKTDPDPPKPAAKPTPRVQLEDKKDKPKDESDDQLTSILKDVESELSKAAENQDTKTDQKTEPQANQQAKTTPESEGERTPTASQQLSASQIGNVRRQLQDCWSVPAGAKDAANLVVEIAVTLNRDGSVRRAQIATTARMNDSFYRAAAESALRAVHICSPLEGLPVDKYDTWRRMRLTFDPEEMFDS
jgi:outer membrane biosynthesis protein TonB